MAKEKKHDLRSRLFVFLLVLLFFGGVSLFSGGRRYSVVPNYELMVKDVKAGDATIRIPEMEAFPEGEYYCHVSYAGKWPGRPAEGYLIHPKAADGTAGEGYQVKCHPEDEYDLQPNMTFLDIPMYLSETAPDKIKDGFWVKQFIFELDGYTYWVRYESRHGVVENVQPVLEKITRSLLGEEVTLEGAWEHETTVSLLGDGVIQGQSEARAIQRFEFREDGTGAIITEFYDDHPTAEIAFRYSLEDDTVTIYPNNGGNEMVFVVSYRDDSLQLSNRRGDFDLIRVG